MATVNEKMTAIADKTRTLTGATGKLSLDGIATNLQTANTEVDTQADLIAQIVSALEGKGVGGGASVETCNSNTIGTFTYEEKTFSFIKGMTWEEFMDSTMNSWTDDGSAWKFVYSSIGIQTTQVVEDGVESAVCVSVDGENAVLPSESIIDGQSYLQAEYSIWG